MLDVSYCVKYPVYVAPSLYPQLRGGEVLQRFGAVLTTEADVRYDQTFVCREPDVFEACVTCLHNW